MAAHITIVSKTNLDKENSSRTKNTTIPNRLYLTLMYLSISDTAKQTRESKEILWKILIQIQLLFILK